MLPFVFSHHLKLAGQSAKSYKFSGGFWATRLPILALAACLPALAWSAPISLSATDDTFITEHENLSGPSSTHGNDTSLFSILATHQPDTHYRSYPLVRFDLATYAGTQVTGPVTFSMYLQGTYFGQAPFARQVSVHQVLTPWTGSAATFNNFGAQPGVQPSTDISAALDTIAVVYGQGLDGYVSWTLGAGVVQGWIDNPTQNFGLLINNLDTRALSDLQFGSLESENKPMLSSAVPVSSTFALVVAGLLVSARRLRPRPLARQHSAAGA